MMKRIWSLLVVGLLLLPTLGDAQSRLKTTGQTGEVSSQVTIGREVTYRVVDKGATTVGSATAPFLVIQGSSTRTVRITRVRFSSTAGTGGAADVWVAKFSSISGGTTRTAPTIAKADSNDAASTVVVAAYSTVPSTATLADGYWSATRYEVVTAAVTVLPEVVDLDWTDSTLSAPLVLRGTGQWVGIGISAAGTTPVHDLTVEWVETLS